MGNVVLRRLSPTDLSWFAARSTAATATPGLRLPASIVRSVMRLGRNRSLVSVLSVEYNGRAIVERSRPLRAHGQHWIVGPTQVTGARYADVRRDDIAFLWFARREPATSREAKWLMTWDVLRQSNHPTASLFEMCRRHLEDAATTRVHGKKAMRLLNVAERRLPVFGGGADAADTGGLTDEDWEDTREWFLRHTNHTDLEAVLASESSPLAARVLRELKRSRSDRTHEELTDRVLRRFGINLLSDPSRRNLIVDARYKRRLSHAPKPVWRWVRGGPSATTFVEKMGLPPCMAGEATDGDPAFEDVDTFVPLKPLHTYQQQLSKKIIATLDAKDWSKRRAVIWLPTGTGKTRVTVETLLMHAELEAPRNCILWVADRGELCEQAIATFRHVWTVQGAASRTCESTGPQSLRVVRQWGSRDWHEIPLQPTVVVASIQTLDTRLRQDENFAQRLANLGARCVAVVFDEAHHVVAPSYGRVITALGLGRNYNALRRNRTSGAPLLGLTATPARANEDETEKLAKRFDGRLLEPGAAYRSLAGFQKRKFMSVLRTTAIKTKHEVVIRERELAHYREFHRLSPTVLDRLGSNAKRTAFIVKNLEGHLRDLRSVLVFAPSVANAHAMAEALSDGGHRAVALDGTTPRPLRQQAVRRFREGSVQVLVNCDLLATGFDAPKIDAVAIARPVESRVLFAQMVGRGLRGPANGGTAKCVLLDYEDRIPTLGNLEKLRRQFRREFTSAAWE